jgi:hypothetical protein
MQNRVLVFVAVSGLRVEAGRAPSGTCLPGAFIRQEQVALPDFLANRFGRAYGQSGQVQSIG